MDENQLLIVLIGMLDAGLAAYAANPYNTRALPTGITSQRAFQPRQQGAPEGPAIIVNHSGTRQIGFPKRFSKQLNPPDGDWVKVQGQRYESTYHIEALIPQSPAEPNAMTESDVLNVARFILQSDEAVAVLTPQNIGVLRVTDLRSNYIVDDKEQNENVPFFEVTFSHRIEFSAAVPLIDVFKTVFNRV